MKFSSLVSAVILGNAWSALALPEGEGVVTDYHGTPVADPFRFFEEKGHPGVERWSKELSAEAFAKLAAMPDREQIGQSIEALGKSQGDKVGWILEPVVGHYFFLMRRQTDEIELLFEKKPDGDPVLLLDPRKVVDGNGDPVTIQHFSVSPDLKWIAVGISSGGGENASLYLVERATGLPKEGPFTRARWGPAQWLADSSGFFFNRLQHLAAGADLLQTFQQSKVWFHRIGTPESKDLEAFGIGVHPDVPVKSEDLVFLRPSSDGKWAVAFLDTGVSSDSILYIAPLPGVLTGTPDWRKVTDRADLVGSIEIYESGLYMMSRKNAPNGKIVRLSLDAPDAGTTPVFAAASGSIQSFVARTDGLYVRILDGGPSRLLRLPWDAADQPVEIPMPESGKISLHEGLGAYPDRGGITFTLGSWTRPARLMRVDAGATQPVLLDLPQLTEPAISKDLVSREIKIPGHDGVEIPVSLMHRKDLTPDGTHPVMLVAYGAYGISIEPGFTPQDAVLMERGGIKVVAHVRGGGELGDEWRLAGAKATKPNTWRDVISVAEGLVKSGYTTPARICVQGRSAGGITAGRTLTTRPDAIGAAVIGVGCLDTVRAENTPNGIPNIPEFGSVVTKPGFDALLEMSSYHHVKDGVSYPPVLLFHGANDTRVELWQSMKMAARLQQAQQGAGEVLMRIDYNLGHGSGGSRRQETDLHADILAFFFAKCR
jgi:prolyl oligopeptidase